MCARRKDRRTPEFVKAISGQSMQMVEHDGEHSGWGAGWGVSALVTAGCYHGDTIFMLDTEELQVKSVSLRMSRIDAHTHCTSSCSRIRSATVTC